MDVYRLSISLNGKFQGYFESDTPWAHQAMQEIAQRLPTQEGFVIEEQISNGERRYLEAGPAGIKVLGSERSFRPV